MTTSPLDTCIAQYAAALAAFKQSSRPHVTSIINLTETVWNAAHTLPATDWAYFVRHNGLTDRKTQLRYFKVAKVAARLKRHADALPASLYALTRLASLNDDDLSALVADGTIHPTMTIEAVKHITPGAARTDPKSPKASTRIPAYSVSVSWFTAEFTPARARSVIKTLQAFLDKHADSLGLEAHITKSVDVDLALLADERKTVAA